MIKDILILLLINIPLLLSQEILIMEPIGDTYKYLNNGGIYICYYTYNTDSVQEYKWLINGVEYNSTEFGNSLTQENSIDYSRLTFTSFTDKFNGTTIQCESIFTDGNKQTSLSSTIYLQGPPSKVGLLEASAMEYSFNVTWMAPFTFMIDTAPYSLSYNVLIYNRSSEILIKNDTVYDKLSYIWASPDRPVACDDFVFIVIPDNLAGLGNSSQVFHINQAPSFEQYYLEDENLVLSIQLSTPICVIQSVLVQNLDLLRNDSVTDIVNYTSILNFTTKKFHYYLPEIQLKQRFRYSININITFSLFRTSLQFTVSTHDVGSVTVLNTLPNTVRIVVTYSNKKTINAAGTFLVFLNCDDGVFERGCFFVNFERSEYIAIDKRSSQNFTMLLYPGKFQILAYDLGVNGNLEPSGDGLIVYPASEASIYIEDNDVTFNNAGSLQCNMSYFNDTIKSVSQCDKKRQIILQSQFPFTAHRLETTIVEACQLKNFNINPIDNYSVVFPINLQSGILNSHPIGRGINYNADVSILDVCPGTTDITTVQPTSIISGPEGSTTAGPNRGASFFSDGRVIAPTVIAAILFVTLVAVIVVGIVLLIWINRIHTIRLKDMENVVSYKNLKTQE